MKKLNSKIIASIVLVFIVTSVIAVLVGFGTTQITSLVDSVENEIFSMEDKEIHSQVIGELLMNKLKDLDAVAYVRFASVYREFKDVNTFMDELKRMLK